MNKPPLLPPSKSASDFFNNSEKEMGYLAGRWYDESKYEDINDYKTRLQKTADKFGVKITKMLKSPFGCEFQVDGRIFKMTMKLNGQHSYERIGWL